MFYVFTHKIAEDNEATYTTDLPLDLTAGVIHQVDVLFQDGCSHLVEVQIFQANHQLWPTNRGATLKGNATVISFREFHELAPGGSDLTARITVDETISNVEVIVQIGLLPKAVIQPLSFEELLSAAAGYE